MKFLFLSTHNFATNPRLVKEVELALDNGHEVDVICFEFNNWSYPFNQKLKKKFAAANITIIQANRKPWWPWFRSVALEKLYRLIGRFYPLTGKTLSQAVSRRTILLMEAIKKKDGPYDLVVGHNPGALFPSWFAANRFESKCGFDVEDYHPGEGDDKHVQRLTKRLMNDFLPLMNYVTFAAPLMKTKSIEDIGSCGKNWIEIFNFFSKNEFTHPQPSATGPLKIIWFSQNVNYKRGLETIIPMLANFREHIELTLIGNRKANFFDEFLVNYPFVRHIPSLDQKSLHRCLSEYDVGLAVEPGKDYNNNIAWSNKLLTYFQSGLFVLASDTPGNQLFFTLHAQHGEVASLSNGNARVSVEKMIASKEKILAKKDGRFARARDFNWENEAQKLLCLWRSL